MSDDHKRIVPVLGDLPPGEALWMARTNLSPCCHGLLIAEPKGGLSQNVWCADCRTRYNIMGTHPPIDWGQVVVLHDRECPAQPASSPDTAAQFALSLSVVTGGLAREDIREWLERNIGVPASDLTALQTAIRKVGSHLIRSNVGIVRE